MASLEILGDAPSSPPIVIPAVEAETSDQMFYLVASNGTLSVSTEMPIEKQAETLGGVMRASNRWVILMKPKGKLLVNQTPILGLYVLSHQDSLEIGTTKLRFHDDVTVRTLPEDDLLIQQHAECTIAKRALKAGDVVVCCPSCKRPHLQSGWEENGGCGDRVCRYRFHKENTPKR